MAWDGVNRRRRGSHETDHDILVRMDERQEFIADQFRAHVVKFDAHVKKDDDQFEAIKWKINYACGGIVVLVFVIRLFWGG